MEHQFIWSTWTAVGLLGQGFFSARFVIQWLASERRKASVIPRAFWIFSLLGSVVLLAYGIHRKDQVIIVGQIPGVFIYTRNLWLIHRTGQTHSAEAAPIPPASQ
ncbi:MAG TPA: lipid-A-disaccharide synthase N-terminal domain-containing protein [Thermoanaerobaculia bacterium]|nr:lipid-A-disaccharide synthase N-terminal domain-containing protein [Thermoanaerobaculia bacterium]